MSRARPRALRCAMSERSRDRARAERREACDARHRRGGFRNDRRGLRRRPARSSSRSCLPVAPVSTRRVPASVTRPSGVRIVQTVPRVNGESGELWWYRQPGSNSASAALGSVTRYCSTPSQSRSSEPSGPGRSTKVPARVAPARPRARAWIGSSKQPRPKPTSASHSTSVDAHAQAEVTEAAAAARAASARCASSSSTSKPSSREQRRERAVQLVAEAAATAQGDLLGERDLVELDRARRDGCRGSRTARARGAPDAAARSVVRGRRRPAVGTQARQIRERSDPGRIGPKVTPRRCPAPRRRSDSRRRSACARRRSWSGGRASRGACARTRRPCGRGAGRARPRRAGAIRRG